MHKFNAVFAVAAALGEGPLPDACFFSFIECGGDGEVTGWVPDLPEVRAVGGTEADVIRTLSRNLRQRLHDMILSGQPLPRARSADELPTANAQQRRRLLLLIG